MMLKLTVAVIAAVVADGVEAADVAAIAADVVEAAVDFAAGSAKFVLAELHIIQQRQLQQQQQQQPSINFASNYQPTAKSWCCCPCLQPCVDRLGNTYVNME